jgi:hypothetical protein
MKTYQIGDYVRIKDGVPLVGTDEKAYNWQGKILQFEGKDKELVLIELDAFTLENLSDDYLKDSVESGTDFKEYYFGLEDLEPVPVPRRDTDALFNKAKEKTELRADAFDEEEDEEDTLDYDLIGTWQNRWENSAHFAAAKHTINPSYQWDIQMFAEYAFNYEGDQPREWTVYTVETVCCGLFPRKISASAKDIGAIVDTLVAFFDWLHQEGIHPQAAKMRDKAKNLKPQIIKIASNPSNWGMAKTMVMGGMAAGYDMTDQSDIDAYISQSSPFYTNNKGTINTPKPAKENPFKNLGRNAVIRVKYQNGTEKQGKFKHLENDLRGGKCELI